jgi:hypothetical protein
MLNYEIPSQDLRPTPTTPLFNQPGSEVPPCLIAQWYTTYGLGELDSIGLKKLGFQIGDKIKNLAPKDWKEAGFLPLQWRCILQADEKYCAKTTIYSSS